VTPRGAGSAMEVNRSQTFTTALAGQLPYLRAIEIVTALVTLAGNTAAVWQSRAGAVCPSW